MLRFLMLGQVGNIWEQLHVAAHQKLDLSELRMAPKLEDVLDQVDEDFLQTISWHKVAGSRYKKGLLVLADPHERFVQRAMEL